MTCNVCFEEYNKSSRKRVTCGACDWSACAACNARYIRDEPHCMNCKTVWDTEFVVFNLSRNLAKQIEKNKARALLQREFRLLPQTQHYLRYDTHIRECVLELRLLQNQTPPGGRTRRIKPRWFLASDLHSSKQRIRVLKSYVSAWNGRQAMLDTRHVPPELLLLATTEGPEVNKVAFACPDKGCNGFVMEADWKCGVCVASHCERCHGRIHALNAHVCEPNDVQTARSIMHTTRPCPECHVRIHKISGCDQMWCTRCNTAFSWETGKVEESGSTVHNPHYFEWQANHGLPMYDSVVDRSVHLKDADRWYLMAMYRLNTHIRSTETRRFSEPNTDNNLDIRLRWLKREITEPRMADLLHRRHKKKEINGHRLQVFREFVSESVRLFRTFLNTEEPVVDAFRALVTRTNKRFEHLCKTHKLDMPCIDILIVGDSGRCVFDIYKHNGYIPMKNYLKSVEA